MRETMLSDTTTGEPATGTEIRYRLLGEAVERFAGQIEAVTECLLRATRVLEEAAPCCEESAGRSWQYTSWLVERLRAELTAARAWHQGASGNHVLNVGRLRDALAILGWSIDRASLLVDRAEIALATSGVGTYGIGGDT